MTDTLPDTHAKLPPLYVRLFQQMYSEVENEPVRETLTALRDAGASRTNLIIHLERLRAANEVTDKNSTLEDNCIDCLDLLTGYCRDPLEWPDEVEAAREQVRTVALASADPQSEITESHLHKAVDDLLEAMDQQKCISSRAMERGTTGLLPPDAASYKSDNKQIMKRLVLDVTNDKISKQCNDLAPPEGGRLVVYRHLEDDTPDHIQRLISIYETYCDDPNAWQDGGVLKAASFQRALIDRQMDYRRFNKVLAAVHESIGTVVSLYIETRMTFYVNRWEQWRLVTGISLRP